MKIPHFVTHYYLPETGPLRSLSDLSPDSNNPVLEDLTNALSTRLEAL
jgi:hypothetical protein